MLPEKPSFLYPTSLFLFLTTVVIYRYLYNQKNPQLFVQLYLAIMAFKLLVYGGYAIAIVVLDQQGAVENVAYFLAIYFTFTALEVGFLYHRISDKT